MTRSQGIRRTWARWLARQQARRVPVARPWTELGEGAGAEARAGALLRQAIVRAPMSETQLAAVRAQLRRGRAPVVRWARLSQVAVGLAVMLAAGALLGAASRFWIRSQPASVPRAVPAVAAPPRPWHPRVRGRDDVTAPPIEPARAIQAISDPLSRSAVVGPGRGSALRAAGGEMARKTRVPGLVAAASEGASVRARPSGAAPAVAEASSGAAPLGASQLAEESRLLALALKQLRQDDDPTAALATLDEHAARFGQRGALIPEAGTARVEVLLRLGRHSDALVLLDGMALATGGRSRALLAARAELRAEQGRCSAASLDFDRLLDRGIERDAIVERALHGRAGCRAQADDVAGARADLETYLARFPDGRFAADARATLRR